MAPAARPAARITAGDLEKKRIMGNPPNVECGGLLPPPLRS
jgi:hypothetical protein